MLNVYIIVIVVMHLYQVLSFCPKVSAGQFFFYYQRFALEDGILQSVEYVEGFL